MKIKILDTNILLDRPLEHTIMQLSYELEGPLTIIIPLPVLMELDTFKKGDASVNVYCRSAIRLLEYLRKSSRDSGYKLSEGVPYNNVIIKVHVTQEDIDRSKVDNKIILLGKELQETYDDVSIVTEDIAERIIADVLGVEAEGFVDDEVDVDKLYTGKAEIKITDNQLQEFMSTYNPQKLKTRRDLLPNQFVIMEDPTGVKHYGIYNASEKCIVGLRPVYTAWGIKPKKSKKHDGIVMEQAMLLHLLLDPSIELVTAIGPSGCGKTLLTLAAALEQTIGNNALYNKIIVMRPLKEIGKDIGALPGNKLEKLEPWMASTFDNLEFLLQNYHTKDGGMYMSTREKAFELIEQGVLELEAMTYIRGRSIPKQFIIIDDAQNLTPDQAISILTRAGDGTKVVFLGDISKQQIDDHRLSPSYNGLAYLVDKAKGMDTIVGHITMDEVVRSRLAQLGVDIGNGIKR